MLAATIASISTPVCALVVASASMRSSVVLLPCETSRPTLASGSGCASGIKRAVCFAAMMPGKLRGDERIALRQRRVAQRLGRGGLIRTSACARAVRAVTGLLETSTMEMRPSARICEGFCTAICKRRRE